jgi:hypothetical protein
LRAAFRVADDHFPPTGNPQLPQANHVQKLFAAGTLPIGRVRAVLSVTLANESIAATALVERAILDLIVRNQEIVPDEGLGLPTLRVHIENRVGKQHGFGEHFAGVEFAFDGDARAHDAHGEQGFDSADI